MRQAKKQETKARRKRSAVAEGTKETVASQRAERLPKVSKEEHAAAQLFLKNSPFGQRLQHAEHALVLLLKNELPKLRQFVFNSQCNLRTIIDIDKFEALIRSSATTDEIINETRTGGHIRVSLSKEKINLVLFYGEQLSANEATLFAKSLAEMTAVTYAALGLDMSGFISVDPAKVERPADALNSVKPSPERKG